MGSTGQALLLAAFILATSIWVGGYVTIAVVARTATATLKPADRVMFFRRLGRVYLWVGLPALGIALGIGAVLLRDQTAGPLLVSCLIVAALLVCTLAVAIAQARRMTRLRADASKPDAAAELLQGVERDGRRAAVLRAVLGLLSLALVVQGAFLAT